MSEKKFDIFISHASEDKDTVARPLATKLVESGFTVWYDEFSLQWGDSLSKSIGRGLADSTYGVVILSPNFFNKKWTQMELDALIALTVPGEKKILPLRYNLSQDELARQQPLLSGILSRSWEDDGLNALVAELKQIVRNKKQVSIAAVSTSEQIPAIADDKIFEDERGDF